ncbi:hypothetical protein NMG60_11021084 [Bertholletia excelsa]
MGTGKKKIEIKLKEKESHRMVTFSKRRQGLFKKARELHSLTGAHMALLVFSPAGRPYIQGDPYFEATVHRFLNASDIEGGIAGCSQNKAGELKAWLDGIAARVKHSDSVDDLVLAKKEMEEIRAKVLDRLNDEEVLSWLVP